MREIYDRIAPGLYNMLTANSSLANGEVGALAFMKLTVAPLLRETTDKLNAELTPTYGGDISAEYEDVVPEDKAQKLAEIESFAKYHTVDEVRVEKFGNEPDPDPERGKLFVVQVNAQTGAPEPVQTMIPANIQAQETPQPARDVPPPRAEEMDKAMGNETGSMRVPD